MHHENNVTGAGMNYKKMWRHLVQTLSSTRGLVCKAKKQDELDDPTVVQKVLSYHTFRWHMRQIGIIRAKGRKNAKLKESVAVSRKRLDFITRDQRLRGEHVEKQPIVLMFDEVAFHEQPHDTTSLFNKMVGAFILRVLLGGASPSRAAASVAAVAVAASPSGFYVFSHHQQPYPTPPAPRFLTSHSEPPHSRCTADPPGPHCHQHRICGGVTY
mmetsp:Transcript_23897/g.61562  ORF Transcript_23897/g.61562 Transcript_23897/m.61562 type:complete len:214 (-) Transcript_23897:60-701(-)